MTEKYLFDACAIIAYLNDEDGSDKIESLLWESSQEANRLFMHEINLLEIYYGIYRDEGELLAEETYGKVINLPITMVAGLKPRVFKEAGRIKATYRVSLADSIALAQAKLNKCWLVTCDHHEFDFLQEEKELDFFWIR